MLQFQPGRAFSGPTTPLASEHCTLLVELEHIYLFHLHGQATRLTERQLVRDIPFLHQIPDISFRLQQ